MISDLPKAAILDRSILQDFRSMPFLLFDYKTNAPLFSVKYLE